MKHKISNFETYHPHSLGGALGQQNLGGGGGGVVSKRCIFRCNFGMGSGCTSWRGPLPGPGGGGGGRGGEGGVNAPGHPNQKGLSRFSHPIMIKNKR